MEVLGCGVGRIGDELDKIKHPWLCVWPWMEICICVVKQLEVGLRRLRL